MAMGWDSSSPPSTGNPSPSSVRSLPAFPQDTSVDDKFSLFVKSIPAKSFNLRHLLLARTIFPAISSRQPPLPRQSPASSRAPYLPRGSFPPIAPHRSRFPANSILEETLGDVIFDQIAALARDRALRTLKRLCLRSRRLPRE